ncbi:MAG: hypothetical protein RLZZ607_771, partial [Pseudomonadota bacterium]
MVIRFTVGKDLAFAALSDKQDLIGLQLGSKVRSTAHKSKDTRHHRRHRMVHATSYDN